MRVTDLKVDLQRLAALCHRYGVAKLEAFGSFVRGDAGRDSDLDLLVTYVPGYKAGLDFVALQQELEQLIGRHVDLLSRASIENSPNKYFRRFALRQTEPLYERT